MTENEAMSVLHYLLGCENAVDAGEIDEHNCLNSQEKEALKFILEEIQQYRAIGTIDEFKAFKLGILGNKGFITIGQTMEEFEQKIRAKAIDECIKVIEESVWRDTDMLVESIRELKEGAEWVAD